MAERPHTDNNREPNPLQPPLSHITLAHVPFDEFVEAQRDPKVAKALREAKEVDKELAEAGRIYPGG
jgi:hypothetical protein